MSDVTHILSAIQQGDPHAAGRLLPLVYDELRKLAAQKLAQEKPGHTLQATALVHEAYLRLVDVDKLPHWDGRGHFFAAAAEAMRRILVENAHRKRSGKHGGGLVRRDLDDVELAAPELGAELLALDEALDRLAARDPVKADLVKLRHFAGLTIEEAAQALGISMTTANRYWAYARLAAPRHPFGRSCRRQRPAVSQKIIRQVERLELAFRMERGRASGKRTILQMGLAMKEETLFAAALGKASPAERAAFLDEACGDDPALRQRVEALLKSHDDAEFLNTPAVKRAAEDVGGSPTSATAAEATDGDDPDSSLDFLTPSDKPGSLGRLGHYEILEVIGRGGMGIVLRAFDDKLHRVAAIKVMAPSLPANGAARQRFVREARAAAAVRDEHVVGVYAVEEGSATPYLVMEYIAGVSLQERLDRGGPLEVKEVLRIGLQAASGMAAAHAQGLIHRDVKPANILLENHVERVKITDFGLARAVDDASLTQEGVLAGTPQYMAPEQARGETLDHRADLFSLGSVLYALCTGHPPFRAENTLAVLKRVCEDTPRPIRETNPDVPPWLVEIIAKLQAKDPAERFQSAQEVAELLGRELAAVQRGDVERPPTPRPAPPAKRSRRWLFVAAAVLLLFAAGFVLTESIGMTHVTATVLGRFTPNTPPVAKGEEGRNDVNPAEPPAPAASGPVQPFVILANADRGEKSYETLAEAVSVAASGDVIEIRGNGPFVSPAIPTLNGRLTIRAGVGARPVILWQPETPGFLLDIRADLILEGIEIQARIPSEGRSLFTVIQVGSPAGSVRLVNCRIQLSRRNPNAAVVGTIFESTGIYSSGATVALRNCEVVSEDLSGHAIWMYGAPAVRQQLMLDNCVVASANRSYGGLGVANNTLKSPFDVRLTRNTFAGPIACSFGWSASTATRRTLPAPELYRFDSAENVFATGLLFTVFTAVPSPGPSAEVAEEQKQVLAPADARRVFRDLLTWREQRNVYNSTTDFYGLYGANNRFFKSEMDLAHWADYWGQAKTSSRQGDVLLKGGNLANWTGGSATPTADDFRLREGSAGKGIGEGGRDPGADVDLVGPGPAYERWKKTPAYQDWLKESGQKR